MSDKTGSNSNSRIIRVRDLPVYTDRKNDDIARYMPRLPDDPENSSRHHWFYSRLTQTIQHAWNENKELRLRIVRAFHTAETQTKVAIDSIHDDETLLPKVGLVTIAGLGGLLLAHKGGPVRKTFYSSAAALLALGACYPKQSISYLDQLYLRFNVSSDGKSTGNSSPEK